MEFDNQLELRKYYTKELSRHKSEVVIFEKLISDIDFKQAEEEQRRRDAAHEE